MTIQSIFHTNGESSKKSSSPKILKILLHLFTCFLTVELTGGLFFINPHQAQAVCPPPGWYDLGWKYRRKITIDHTKIPNTDQNNFPVLINVTNSDLKHTDYGGRVAQEDGADIIFTNCDGLTRLNREIEAYDPCSGTLIAWVKIPGLSCTTDTEIYVYYGKDFYATTYKISIDSPTHEDYGVSYPVTYVFGIPSLSSNLKVYKRYNESQPWTEIPEKTSDDFFNGVEAARFDYSNNRAYISVAFDASSDDVYLKICKINGNLVSAPYIGTAQYYDNRKAVVTSSADDWTTSYNYAFASACDAFTSRQIWFTPCIITQYYAYTNSYMNADTWALIQSKIDAGYIEPASHSRTHQPIPYNYEYEIGGSKQDIIDNLTLPALMKSGDTEYVYTYIEPYGQTSPSVLATAGVHKYAVVRHDGQAPPTWGGYDSMDKIYYAWWTVRIGRDGGLVDPNALNATFDACYTAGGIYHLMCHPIQVNWDPGQYAQQHLDYIEGKTDVWYVGLGLLYCYHYVQAPNKITVTTPTAGEIIPDTGTWDPNFKLVLHLDEAPANNVVGGHHDSTSFKNIATASGFDGTDTSTTNAAGEIGGADFFDGVDTKVTVSNNNNLQGMNKLTIESWVYPQFFTSRDGFLGKDKVYSFMQRVGGLATTLKDDEGDGWGSYVAGPAISGLTGQWNHVALTYDGSKIYFYLNGNQAGPYNSYATGSLNTYNSDLIIGNVGWGTSFFCGAIDEVRISNTVRSSDWIKACYNNQNSPSTFSGLSTSLQGNLNMIFKNLTNTVYSTGYISYNGEPNESDLVSMSIAPSSGFVDVIINTWNTSDTYYKKWTETASASGITTEHIVGDLDANNYYAVKVDGGRLGSYLSNDLGQITFTYNGGYSAKTFEVEEGIGFNKINFAGYEWWVKNDYNLVEPGPNYFSDSNQNAWVDPNGYLHLGIVQGDGRWYCSEVIADSSFGYGTYIFTVQGRVDLLDENIVLGLLTRDDYAPQYHYREMDVGFSRWGDANDPNNTQFVVQPWDTAGNMFRFNIDLAAHPNETTTHIFTWSQDNIYFRSYYGDFSIVPHGEDIIAFWPYTGGDIPPPGEENPRISFWLVNGNPPANGQGAEIVIKDFKYVPDTTAEIDFADFALFAAHWLETDCGNCGGADLTGDGNVDTYDLGKLTESWLGTY